MYPIERYLLRLKSYVRAMSNIQLDSTEWVQAHRYVLFNSNEIIPFRELHKERIKSRIRPRRVPEEVINKIHIEEFCDWFRNYVVAMSNTEKVGDIR
ncbi:hypothetical protein CMV_005138 [Castanea mollissima]|uniref:Uncharacterized protein n=1 Tax=Castanea mollissima TaxID=60419 RepID=A0A8J4RDK5_9ROSI|nr:hypothetical protein CMV_005138 [Castanea mollissima]